KLPNKLPFSDTELCSLLSNALENAMHAAGSRRSTRSFTEENDENLFKTPCRSVTSVVDSSSAFPRPCVNLYIYTKSTKLCIDIRNNYQTEPVFEQGLPVSTEAGHGFGTKSMAYIVEKHGGVFQFSVRDGWFIFQASV
ncbi:MAG: GHKL domain-containing protein, partial [Treponema sp.]|nr:GHKL domain-containing protein [Treponema sp.]